MATSRNQTAAALEILTRSRVFQAAPAADIERLAPHCTHQRYRRGDTIAGMGAVGDTLIVVGRGRIKATLPSPSGEHEFLMAMFWPGDVMGETSLFDQKARPASGVAVTDVEVVFVPRIELLTLLERRPAVTIRLAESLCVKLRTTVELSLSVRFLDTPTRLYNRLLYFARYDARMQPNGERIQHGLSQQELGDSIGASREALNKLLSEWRREGLVECGRGFVVIRDREALAHHVSGQDHRGNAAPRDRPDSGTAEGAKTEALQSNPKNDD